MDSIVSLKLDTRHKILNAALFIAARNGFIKATTDQIAKRAKVSEGIIYHYFKSKDELCFEMIKEHAEGYRHQLVKEIENILKAKDKLERLIDFHFQYFTREGNIFQIIFGKSGGSPLMFNYILKVAIIPYSEIIEDIIRYGIESGEFKDVEPVASASGLLGMMQINILRLHFGPTPLSAQKIEETIKQIFFGGLLKK